MKIFDYFSKPSNSENIVRTTVAGGREVFSTDDKDSYDGLTSKLVRDPFFSIIFNRATPDSIRWILILMTWSLYVPVFVSTIILLEMYGKIAYIWALVCLLPVMVKSFKWKILTLIISVLLLIGFFFIRNGV